MSRIDVEGVPGRELAPKPRFKGLNELTGALGVSYHTGYRLAQDGLIKSVTIGSRILVPIDEFERILVEGAPRRRTRGGTE